MTDQEKKLALRVKQNMNLLSGVDDGQDARTLEEVKAWCVKMFGQATWDRWLLVDTEVRDKPGTSLSLLLLSLLATAKKGGTGEKK